MVSIIRGAYSYNWFLAAFFAKKRVQDVQTDKSKDLSKEMLFQMKTILLWHELGMVAVNLNRITLWNSFSFSGFWSNWFILTIFTFYYKCVNYEIIVPSENTFFILFPNLTLSNVWKDKVFLQSPIKNSWMYFLKLYFPNSSKANLKMNFQAVNFITESSSHMIFSSMYMTLTQNDSRIFWLIFS